MFSSPLATASSLLLSTGYHGQVCSSLPLCGLLLCSPPDRRGWVGSNDMELLHSAHYAQVPYVPSLCRHTDTQTCITGHTCLGASVEAVCTSEPRGPSHSNTTVGKRVCQQRAGEMRECKSKWPLRMKHSDRETPAPGLQLPVMLTVRNLSNGCLGPLPFLSQTPHCGKPSRAA